MLSSTPPRPIDVYRDLVATYILDPAPGSPGPPDDVVCSWYAQPDEQREFRHLLSAARDSVQRSHDRYVYSLRHGDSALIERAKVLLDTDRARQVRGLLQSMGMGWNAAELSRTMEHFQPHVVLRAYKEQAAATVSESESAAQPSLATRPAFHQPRKLPQHSGHPTMPENVSAPVTNPCLGSADNVRPTTTRAGVWHLRRFWPAFVLAIASALLSPVWTYHVNVRWQPSPPLLAISSPPPDCAIAMFLPFAEAVGETIHPLIRKFDWQIDAIYCELLQAKGSLGCTAQYHHLVPRIPCSYVGSTQQPPNFISLPDEGHHHYEGLGLCNYLISIENDIVALGHALRNPSGIWQSLVHVEHSLDLFLTAFESIPPSTALTPWTSHLRTATPRALSDLPSNLLTLTVPYLVTYLAFPEYSSLTLWPLLPSPNRNYDIARAEIRNAWSAATDQLLPSLKSSIPEVANLSDRLTQTIAQYPFLTGNIQAEFMVATGDAEAEAEDEDDDTEQELLYRYPEEIRIRNIATWQAKLPLDEQLRQAYQRIEAAIITTRVWSMRDADIWEARGARVNGFGQTTADWKLRRRWALASEGWRADGRRVT